MSSQVPILTSVPLLAAAHLCLKVHCSHPHPAGFIYIVLLRFLIGPCVWCLGTAPQQPTATRDPGDPLTMSTEPPKSRAAHFAKELPFPTNNQGTPPPKKKKHCPPKGSKGTLDPFTSLFTFPFSSRCAVLLVQLSLILGGAACYIKSFQCAGLELMPFML